MGLRAAIDAKCKDCAYDPLGAGNWRQQVGACTARTCPLWPYRPQSKPRPRRPADRMTVRLEDAVRRAEEVDA